MGSRFVSAATSDVGSVRGNNEDRVYVDADRGIYLVVDGMGGQAAGEEAADIAVKTVRSRLERPTEGAEQRVREAIALANNAIYEAASNNAAWRGMACVLTLALIEDGHAIVGHVGDSRAYQIRGGKIQKITRDHSPVGEREDAGQLTEDAAMHHPRRNEVFRDVGSTPRTPDDADFIDIKRIPVPDDSALLLCSDGLSDVVPSRRILQVVEENAHDCAAAVRTLVRAAVADGKDNVSVVLIEGLKFPDSVKVIDLYKTKPPVEVEPETTPRKGPPPNLIYFLLGIAFVIAGLAVYSLLHPKPAAPPPVVARTFRVGSNKGEFATEVTPGIYPEKIILKSGITLRSSRPGAATIKGGVVADAVSGAVLRDLKIGEAGVEINSSNIRMEGIDSSGEIIFTGISTGSLRGSHTGSINVLDTAAPEISVNFIAGDISFVSTGLIKLDGNAIQGVLYLPNAPPPGLVADLLKRNIFSNKKPIQKLILKEPLP
jgi:serine/threonine protein phosphatase PrpC